MKQIIAHTEPTVGITINKSRLKLYNKTNDIPVYYLQKGQEFQIELFNPTCDTILAKITLNNRMISQGGLVIRPGERIFLDRYFDVPNKFKFDTYEVNNSEAVRNAIRDNGDIKVQFYREQKVAPYYNGTILVGNSSTGTYKSYPNHTTTIGGSTLKASNARGITNTSYEAKCSTYTSGNVGSSALYSSDCTAASVTLDMMNLGSDILAESEAEEQVKDLPRSRTAKFKRSTIETGRIEAGSHSDQKFKQVSLNFEYYAFHTVEYKLLPVSQKINASEDMKVKIYCTNCGAKMKPEHKFCSNCGNKQ